MFIKLFINRTVANFLQIPLLSFTLYANNINVPLTKRRFARGHYRLINPDHSKFQGIRKFPRKAEIVRVRIRGETFVRVVGKFDGVVFTFKFANCGDRAENFFFVRGHVGLHVGEDGGLEETRSEGGHADATVQQSGALFDRLGHDALNLPRKNGTR